MQCEYLINTATRYSYAVITMVMPILPRLTARI